MSLNKETIGFFARYIESRTGIQYSETNFYQLENRLNAIATRLGYSSLESLYTACVGKSDAKLERIIIEEATNHETSFFRDGSIFRAFGEWILPEVLKERASDFGATPVRIWSCACSSGQEAYSLAMICHELGHLNVQILCTDLSAKILARAKTGIFTELEIKRGLDPKRRDQFFESVSEDGNPAWKARDGLRRMLDFREHNLLGSWSGIGTFDIIFIRNVLIYQSVDNKKTVIRHIRDHLAPKGFLIMGAAESLIGITDEFDQRGHGGALFYQKRPAAAQAS
jgi:chemotaxis protein methyltransferase CheR